jgi:MFS family permease
VANEMCGSSGGMGKEVEPIITKIAIGWYFFVMGTVLGDWASIIPRIKEIHNINNGELGGIMVGVVLGAICVIPIVTKLIEKYGSALTVRLGSVILVLLFPIIGISGNIGILIAGMVMLGFSVGFLDISINGQAVLFEKSTGHPHLGLFTSIFAVGNLVGALAGGAMIGPLELSLLVQCVIISGALLIPSMIFSFFLFSFVEEVEITKNTPTISTNLLNNPALEEESELLGSPKDLTLLRENESVNSSPQFSRMLFVVSALSFASYFGEGSVSDWSAIYLSNHQASNFQASFGVAIFQFFLAVGRLYSDYLVVSIGRIALLKLSGILACIGLVIVSLAPLALPSFNLFLVICISGFAISGIGLSVVYPTCVSIAGSCIKGMAPADSIAFVSSIGYIGVMVGPPILGGMSLLISLRYSFLIDAFLLASMTAMTFYLESLDP